MRTVLSHIRESVAGAGRLPVSARGVVRVLEGGDFAAIPLQMQQNGNRGRCGKHEDVPDAREWFARLTAGLAHPGPMQQIRESPESSLIFQVTLNHGLYSATPTNAAPMPLVSGKIWHSRSHHSADRARRATDPPAAIWRPALMLPSASDIYGGQRSCSAFRAT
jgi:hypothetical protein